MTEHDALLHAICENPGEDTPRLVFADWLDEHADTFPNPAAVRARAAFIRDDIGMSQRDEYDPARLRWELIEKPRREVEGWVKETLPQLPGNSTLIHVPLFQRGFPFAMLVKRWAGTGNDSPPAAGFPLERVVFYECGHQAIDTLAKAAWRSRVSALRFHQGPTGLVGMRRLLQVRDLARVTQLAFSYDAVYATELPELITSPLFRQLTELEFTRIPVGHAVAEGLVRHSGAAGVLRTLKIVGCRLPAVWLTELLASPAVSRLESLSAGGDRIGAPEKFRALGRATHLRVLRVLDMSEDAPKESGLEAFLASPLVPELRKLALSRCNLNSARARLLASGTFTNLRVLDLSNNAIGNEGAGAIARSPHLAGLRVLHLSYAQVGDEGIQAILDSPLADGLVLLGLTGSPASAEMKELVKAKMGDRVRV